MSVEIPKMAIALGPYGIDQGDVIEARVHLGATKEVSSWELLLQNWDNKYSPGGTYPLGIGQNGYIDIGRDTNIPQIITTRTESIKYEENSVEHYVRVSGRCWGEKLFRRVVTKTYESQKGEAIVKDLLDYYVGLSHVRGGTELVENTDTTYAKLEYTDSPVWDILKYIAESSDLAGVIGYDFRVAPDGKFEFFPKNSKASSVDLTDKMEQMGYRKDIFRIRNKIMIYGITDKSVPLDKDAWTESLTPVDGIWEATSGSVSFDTTIKAKGTGSIKLYAQNLYYGAVMFTLNSGKEVDCNLYPKLSFLSYVENAYNGNAIIQLFDVAYKSASKNITISPMDWRTTEIGVGADNEGNWETVDYGFDWTHVKIIKLSCFFSGAVGTGSFWVDGLYFGGRRYEAVEEDTASQQQYTDGEPRELSETDEELTSDNECDLRAKALLAYLKDPAEYLTVISTVIDYGNSPLLPADKIYVPFLDADYRIESVEYRVDAKTQTLEISLELGKEPPQLADYLYGLRATTVTVEKLARTKLGKKGIPSFSSRVGGYFTSDIDIDKVTPVLNLRTEGIIKALFGFDSVNAFLSAQAGDLVLSAYTDVIRPYLDTAYDLGNDSFRWSSLYVAGLGRVGWLNIDAYTVITNGRVLQNVTSDAGIITSGQFPLARLPRSTSGYVLEAQGASYDPMYVNPNGRYQPAAHTQHADDMPSGGANTGQVGNTTTYWNCIAGNSVWYKALGLFDALDDLAIIKKIRSNGKVDEKGTPLADPESLPMEVTENDLINAGALMGLLIGAVKQLEAKVESLKKELEKVRDVAL